MKNYIEFSFTQDQRDLMYSHLAGLQHPQVDIEESLFKVFQLQQFIPEELTKLIFEFKRNPSTPGVIYLQNSPIDSDLPVTPENARNSQEKKTYVSENFLLLISQMIGEPIGYNLEKEGSIIHDMCPVKKNEGTISNEGAVVDQKFHFEHAYLGEADMSFEIKQFSSDFFTMLCLKQDAGKKAETWYLHINDILKNMNKEDIEILRKPLFQFYTPFSFTGKDQKLSLPTSLVDGNSFSPNFYCDFGNGMKGITPEAEKVLQRLYDCMYKSSDIIKLKFRPGDMLLANNRKGVHCRTKFDPDYTSDDRRWIQRIYIKNSLNDFNTIMKKGTGKIQRVF